jgi:O-antigen/teichoic acid export membrane protein
MSSNKVIAKNTLLLYFRMFLALGISLYTSRIVLRLLGVEDFGIYNLVGGVVVLFSFLNAAMSSTTQRYINIALTSHILEDVRKVFSVSLNVHLVISIVILILSETVGLWFLNYKLNIPDNRMYAANVVYQISTITTIIGVLQVPYNAMILAHEKFSFFAILGIFESVAKLAVVGVLIYFPTYDYLLLYSLSLAVVSLIINLIYYRYCQKKFKKEVAYKNFKDKTLFTELVSFSSWMLLGQVAVIGATEGLNMILNIFIGVMVNASMGIAMQVNNAVFSFVSNFQIAFRPQLIQSYARNDLDAHKKMVLNTSKYSFLLMAVLSAPVLFYANYILALWLGDSLPPYLVKFVQFVILISVIDSLSGSFWMSAQAIGNIKEYNIVLTIINMLVVPLAYVLLYFGFDPVSVLIGKLGVSVVNQIFRYYFINKYLRFDKKEFFSYFVAVLIPSAYLISLAIFSFDKKLSFFEFVGGVIALEVILLIIIMVFSINTADRKMVHLLIKNKIKK